MPATDADDLWSKITVSLRMQLAESVWFSTFQDVRPVSVDDGSLHLMAPSAYVRDRIMTRYRPLVTDALDDIGEGGLDVQVSVVAGANGDPGTDHGAASGTADQRDTAPATPTTPSPSTPPSDTAWAPSAADLRLEEAGISSDYTFETFVKGSSNQFALAAALRVAET
ncbi:MAG: DnaA N-terminal domain-containing protein, partial [Actinomycetota bacterium]